MLRPKQNGFVTRALTAVRLFVFLIISSGILYLKTGRPRFSGSLVASIDLRREGLTSTLTNSYKISVTNRISCQSIFHELSRARRVFGFSQGATELTFHYVDGQTDVAWLAPGMPKEYYTILIGSGAFRMPRDGLFRALKDGGVDVSEIPE